MFSNQEGLEAYRMLIELFEYCLIQLVILVSIELFNKIRFRTPWRIPGKDDFYCLNLQFFLFEPISLCTHHLA